MPWDTASRTRRVLAIGNIRGRTKRTARCSCCFYVSESSATSARTPRTAAAVSYTHLSKLLLPQGEEEAVEEAWEDPREQLVQQLLEYKQYRDAASILEERGRALAQCYPRLANDLPPRELDPADQPIHELELWDLVSAMGRVLRANELSRPASIVYDDTPIQTHMKRIHERLCEDGQVAFTDMFQASMHKSAMIGVFLAVLELVRHHCVYAEQESPHGEIYLMPGESFANDLELSDVDDYDSAVKPR